MYILYIYDWHSTACSSQDCIGKFNTINEAMQALSQILRASSVKLKVLLTKK